MSQFLQNNAANAITMVRVVAAPLAFIFRESPTLFLTLWTLCGLSDAVDGTVARATGTSNARGARLDTIADLVAYSILVLLVATMVDTLPLLPYWIAIVAVVRLVDLAICAWRFRTFGSVHTWANKFTGGLLFFLPVYILWLPGDLWGWMLFLIALLSALEEGAILLVSKRLDLECPTIWHALNQQHSDVEKSEPNVS